MPTKIPFTCHSCNWNNVYFYGTIANSTTLLEMKLFNQVKKSDVKIVVACSRCKKENVVVIPGGCA